MDANQQVALQIGTLVLANIQLAAQVQELQKQVEELKPKDGAATGPAGHQESAL